MVSLERMGKGLQVGNDELKCPQGELKLAGGAGLLQGEWLTISIWMPDGKVGSGLLGWKRAGRGLEGLGLLRLVPREQGFSRERAQTEVLMSVEPQGWGCELVACVHSKCIYNLIVLGTPYLPIPTLTCLLQVILFGGELGFLKKKIFFNTHTKFYFRFLSSRDDRNFTPNQGIMSFITPVLLLPTLSHTHTATPCIQTLLVCLSTQHLLHTPVN